MAEEQLAGASEEKEAMDVKALYKEEVVTDRRIGVIRVMTPINPDMTRDESRSTLFIGEAQVMTQVGAIPVSFEIPGADLTEAAANYRAAAEKGIKETAERLRELRREAASQIVTPGMPGFQAPPAAGSGSGLVMP